MTGKLIKYEMRSCIRLMTVIWAALLVTSLFFGLNNSGLWSDSDPGTLTNILQLLTGLMYFAVFVALIAASVIIIIMRFYKGILGDEGYLVHTLPVKPWQLITAKGIVALCIVLISILAAFLSFCILDVTSGASIASDLWEGVGRVFRDYPKTILIAIEVFLLLILSLLKSIYQIYAALSIGHLANKHRLILSLGAYIGLNAALTIISAVVFVISEATGFSSWLGSLAETSANGFNSAGQILILLLCVASAIQVAIFHVITERILSLKLNLL